MLCLGEGGELIKTDYYILYNSIQDHHEAIERAYQLIRDNYDIVEDWFSTVGRPGNKFAKHFDCRTRTRFKSKKFKMWGRGVPTGMELGLKYLENLENARGTASPDECVCLDIDLAAVIRSGPRNLDSGLSEISIVFQAAVPKLVASKYTTSGVRRPSEL